MIASDSPRMNIASTERRTRNRRRSLCGAGTSSGSFTSNYSVQQLLVLLLLCNHNAVVVFGFVPRVTTVDKVTIVQYNGKRTIVYPLLQGHPKRKRSPFAMVASAEVPTNERTTTTIGNDHNSQIEDTPIPSTTASSDDLKALGWDTHFANQLLLVSSDDDDDDDDDIDVSTIPADTKQGKSSNGDDETLIPVRITEVRSKSIHVVGAGGIDHLIPITQGQKIINGNDEKVVVAGDWILVEDTSASSGDNSSNSEGESENKSKSNSKKNNNDQKTLKIRKVLNRRSVIKRKAPGRNTRRKQLIASNLNTVFVVSSCNQDFNVARLERYIAMVLETENVEPVVVLTKKDLLLETGNDMNDMDDDDDDDDDDEELEDSTDIMELQKDEDFKVGDMGEDDFDEDDASSWLLDYYMGEAGSIASGTIPVVSLDARNGKEASELLQPWLGEGQTVAFVGSSGVGKSTLVNSLCGFELVKVGDIHTDSGQGRHTTTRRQLHFLKPNHQERCAILDTPGLRELQLVDAAQGLGEVFKDLVELSHQCKFNDCQHSGEPGCAIEAALESGDIEPDRVARWEKLVAEDALNTKDVEEGRIERERKKNKKKKAILSKSKQRNGGDGDGTPPEGRDLRMLKRKTKR